MTTLTISIIVVFVLGYALIATESMTKVNKAAIALLMLVGCWTLYMMDPMQYLQLMHPDYTGGAAGMVEKGTGIIQEHLGDTATTLFFLMGAMTIVEIVDKLSNSLYNAICQDSPGFIFSPTSILRITDIFAGRASIASLNLFITTSLSVSGTSSFNLNNTMCFTITLLF